jgi:hypothetical protein
MKKVNVLLSCIIILMCADLCQAQTQAQGTVFADENKNKRLDDAEKGIAEVAVSNGEEVVLTDSEGRYELPVDDDTIIFVIKPSGYELPVNENQLPQFYYNHKPKGSPKLKYEGVQATGSLPSSVNFGLVKAEQKQEFDILVFGDPQPYTKQEVDYFDRDIINELERSEGYEFGITLGDIVGNDLDLFTPYVESISRVGIPWFNVYGNHDMNFDAQSDRMADETFEAVYGPATHSFNEGKVHFIMLDDVIYPREDGKRGYTGGFTERQLTFIENDLKHVPKDRLIVLAMHIPLALPDRDSPGRFRSDDVQRLFELLKPFPNTLSLSAHSHRQILDFMDEDDGWDSENPHLHFNAGTTSGDWWTGTPDEEGIPAATMRDGTPNGYITMHFEGNTYRYDYKAAGADTSYKMDIWGPRVVAQNSRSRAQLFVNYFLGSPKTKVKYRIGDRKWRSMGRFEGVDPAYTMSVLAWDTTATAAKGRRPSTPAPSTHLWRTGLPDGMEIGTHTVHIRVTDMFGRTFSDEFQYEIVSQ